MRARDEEGQALILALGFLVFFGLVIGAMLSFAEASVLGTERLREQRSTVYAADGATDAAIRIGRVDNTVGAYGDARCQLPGPLAAAPILLTTTATTSDQTAAKVFCTWSPDPLQLDRTVIYTTFVGGTPTPAVRATVTYHDSAGTPPPVDVSWTYCGHDPGVCP